MHGRTGLGCRHWRTRLGICFAWGRPRPGGITVPGSVSHSHCAIPNVEPKLPEALKRLTQNQRIAVVLVPGLEWTEEEVAALIGRSRSTVGTHLDRGKARCGSLRTSAHQLDRLISLVLVRTYARSALQFRTERGCLMVKIIRIFVVMTLLLVTMAAPASAKGPDHHVPIKGTVLGEHGPPNFEAPSCPDWADWRYSSSGEGHMSHLGKVEYLSLIHNSEPTRHQV